MIRKLWINRRVDSELAGQGPHGSCAELLSTVGEAGFDAFGDGEVATADEFDGRSEAAKDLAGSVKDVDADAGIFGEGGAGGGEAAASGFVGVSGVSVGGGDELVRGDAMLVADLDAGLAAGEGDDLAHPAHTGVPDGDVGVGTIGYAEVVAAATATTAGLGSGVAGTSTVVAGGVCAPLRATRGNVI